MGCKQPTSIGESYNPLTPKYQNSTSLRSPNGESVFLQVRGGSFYVPCWVVTIVWVFVAWLKNVVPKEVIPVDDGSEIRNLTTWNV